MKAMAQPLLLLLTILASHSRFTSAQNGDGGGASGVQPGSIGSDPSTAGSADAGAGGADAGSVNISKGATIAIAVVVAIVVFLGVTSAVLFYMAKKRQWQVRASLRRTTKRVTTGLTRVVTPRTPHKMTFSPVEKQRHGSEGTELLKGTEPSRATGTTATKPSTKDLEKCLPSEPKVSSVSESLPATKDGKDLGKKRPVPPKVTVPQSSFEIDSPKTPLWSKIFGR